MKTAITIYFVPAVILALMGASFEVLTLYFAIGWTIPLSLYGLIKEYV